MNSNPENLVSILNTLNNLTLTLTHVMLCFAVPRLEQGTPQYTVSFLTDTALLSSNDHGHAMCPGTLLGITHALFTPAGGNGNNHSLFLLQSLDPWSSVLAVSFAHLVGGLGNRLHNRHRHDGPSLPASKCVQEHGDILQTMSTTNVVINSTTTDPSSQGNLTNNNNNSAMENSHLSSGSMSVNVPMLSDWGTCNTIFDVHHIVTLHQLMNRLSESFRCRALQSRQLKAQDVDVINRVCALLNQFPQTETAITTGQALSNHVPRSAKEDDAVVVGLLSINAGGPPPLQSLPTMLRDMLDCCRQVIVVAPPAVTAVSAAASAVTFRDQLHSHPDNSSATDQNHHMTVAAAAMGLQCVVRE